jgi:xylulokinase
MAGRSLLMGLDVGTTNVKVAAFDLSGATVAVASKPIDAHHPSPGFGEYDPEVLYETVCTLICEVSGEGAADDARIEGLAVASMAETAFPLDGSGRPLRDGLAWWDERGAEQADALAARCGQSWWYGRAGMHLSALVGVSKLLWLRDEAPEVFGRTRAWLNVADYIVYRLTGEMATDRSLGSRLSLMDVTQGEWSTELLSATDLDAGVFAPLVDSGDLVGSVTRDAAERTSLAVGTPVGAGGMDHPVAAFGAGIARPGDVLDSMGTSEAMLGVTEQVALEPAMAALRYQQGIHVVPGANYVLGGLATAGASIEWLYGVLWGGEPGVRDYDRVLAAVRSSPPGSHGLVFLPYLLYLPPGLEPNAGRGALLGVSTATEQADIVRAMIEGVAHSVRFILDSLARDFGVDTSRVLAVGGGTRNAPMMEIKAALFGGSIRVGRGEAATKGAAMLGGVAAGVFDDHLTAVQAMVAPTEEVTAGEDLVETYERLHQERFLPTQQALLPHFGLWT